MFDIHKNKKLICEHLPLKGGLKNDIILLIMKNEPIMNEQKE
jgi:hypothetical protein